MLGGSGFDRERMAAAAATSSQADTDIADDGQARQPFRQAPRVAGLVRTAIESAATLSELSDDEVREHAAGAWGPDTTRLLAF